MSHVVLLGDSIFDNVSYVKEGLAVIDHLRSRMPPDWQATLLAVDGDVTEGVAHQSRQLPADATHLIISCGGNDALGQLGFLQEPSTSIIASLTRLADMQDAFRADYRKMLDHVKTLNKKIAVCTIYDAVPQLDRGSVTGLSLFNDVIVREAAGAQIPVIDLRHICTERNDYSEVSPIEPSDQGGRKIASAIAAFLATS
jgi:hypothetical protein